MNAGYDLAFARLRAANRTIPLFLLTLGPARVIHMPGELFAEYQLAAQDIASGQFVAMAAYGDYGPGYIGTRIAYFARRVRDRSGIAHVAGRGRRFIIRDAQAANYSGTIV